MLCKYLKKKNQQGNYFFQEVQLAKKKATFSSRQQLQTMGIVRNNKANTTIR